MQTRIPVTQRPLFSILHTSARPDQWRGVYDAWLANCKNPGAVEYVLVVDHRWGFTELPTLRPQDKVVWNSGRRCCVDGWNIAASQSTGLVLIVNADDQMPCLDWDQALISKVPAAVDFVIRVSSGARNEQHPENRIMVMPIMSRPRYERQGYVFYPEYESMYADQDLCESAYADGVVVEAFDLLFPHLHPVVDPSVKVDEAYAVQNRAEAYALGQSILHRRRQTEFGKKNLGASPNPGPVLVPTPKKETIGVGLPGERFSSSWVFHWTQLFRDLSAQFTVDPLFCYSSNVYATRTTILEHFLDARPQPDYLLWIDDDNLVSYDQVAQLLMDLKANPEFDMVAGWCWLAGDVYEEMPDPPRSSVGRIGEGGIPHHLSGAELMAGDADLQEIGFTGFPIVLMRRSVLSKVTRSAFAPLFGTQYTRGYAGEDVSFCIRAGEAGVKILVDRRVKVPHLKLRSAEPGNAPVVEVKAAAAEVA